MSATSAAPQLPELTDEDVQRKLAGESVRGPRHFRGRELAPYTKGLRDLCMKVVSPDDTAVLHDVIVIYLLMEAYSAVPDQKLARRMALIAATDDRAGFRAKVSLEFFDDLSDPEIGELRAIVDDILAPVKAAGVQVVAPLGGRKSKKKV